MCYTIDRKFRMKLKIYTQILHSFLVLVLSLGLVSGFAVASESTVPGGQAAATPQSTATAVVTVSPLPSAPLPVVAHNSQNICVNNELPSANLLQDSGVINLHQSASCFSLMLGRVVTQQQLSVAQAEFGRTISVQYHEAVVATPRLAPFLPESVSVVLPEGVADSLLFMILLLLVVAGIGLLAKGSAVLYVTNQRLYYLCVQRC